MTDKDGLICAWLMDGKGGGRELDWDGVAAWKPESEGWLWIHLDYSAANSQAWLQEESGLSPLTVEALIQPETRPRCVPADDGLMVFLRGVNHNPGADPDDMVSIRMWLGEKRIISMRMRRMMSVDTLRQAIGKGRGPADPGEFIVMLADILLDRIGDVVDELYDQVDVLEDSVIVESSYGQREQLAGIRRQTISIRRFLAPQREALNRLAAERSLILTDKHKLHLREHSDRLMRFIEELDAARERAAVTHESLASRMAEQTNQRMYVLSIVAAIFLPLSFLTGLLGINVGGIPGSENAMGFTVVVALMLMVGVMLWAFFHWRRWF